MLMADSNALADSSPLASTGRGELLPPLSNITDLSKKLRSQWVKSLLQKD